MISTLHLFQLHIDGDCDSNGYNRNYNNRDYDIAEFILLWESLQISQFFKVTRSVDQFSKHLKKILYIQRTKS